MLLKSIITLFVLSVSAVSAESWDSFEECQKSFSYDECYESFYVPKVRVIRG